MNQQTTVLVTGASGFIGKNISQRLAEYGYRVRGLVRSPQGLGTTKNKVEQFAGDILDPDSLKRACSGVRVVVHAAGIAHVSNVNENRLHSVNVLGTKLTVSAALDSGVERFILISSVLAIRPKMGLNNQLTMSIKKKCRRNYLSENKSGRFEVVIWACKCLV